MQEELLEGGEQGALAKAARADENARLTVTGQLIDKFALVGVGKAEQGKDCCAVGRRLSSSL